jgi:hypothetical protein
MKASVWKEWCYFLIDYSFGSTEESGLEKVLWEVPAKYRTLVALAMTCAKWAGKHNAFYCGLCALARIGDRECPCSSCFVLQKLGTYCHVDDTLYGKWCRSYGATGMKRREYYRKKIYKTLCEWYTEEYWKVMG